MTEQRLAMIRQRLTGAFTPHRLDIVDESHQHVGHAGAAAGGGHFRVSIVSEAFMAQTTLQRHRKVYAALADMMPEHIHAVSILARTPAEADD